MLKPVIFISAVSRELKSSRQLVANTLTAIGFDPDWQDIFDLSADEIPAMLRKKIDRASGVLQIVGDAYGGECPEVPAGAGVDRCSYTQYEALYAKSVGKPVYYLIASPELPRDLSPDALGEDESKRSLQAEYKRSVLSGRTIHYEVGSYDSTENKVRKLKDELDKLRRGVRRLLGIGGAALAILLFFAVGGIVLQQRNADSAADMDRARELRQRERDVAHQKELAALRTALVRLTDQVARTRQPGADEATKLTLAYAALEQELNLDPGTLERELPRFASSLLGDPELPPSQRQAALYAAGRYAQAEALALEIAENEISRAERRIEAAVDAYVDAGLAASSEKRYADAVSHYEKALALGDRKEDGIRWLEVKRLLAYALESDALPEQKDAAHLEALLVENELLEAVLQDRAQKAAAAAAAETSSEASKPPEATP